MRVSKQQWASLLLWVGCHIAIFLFAPIYGLMAFLYGSAIFSVINVDILYLNPFLYLFVLGLFAALATCTVLSAIHWLFAWHTYVTAQLWMVCSAIAAGIGTLGGMFGWQLWPHIPLTVIDESGSDQGMYIFVYGGVGALLTVAIVQGVLLRRHPALACWWVAVSVLGVTISAIIGSSVFWSYSYPWSIFLLYSYGIGYGILTGSIITRLPHITDRVVPAIDRQEI